MIKVFVLFLFFFLTSQESETISVDDVSDIFKMYGVDYKEVSINCVQSRAPNACSDSTTYRQTALISLLDV